jgi:hypothetical protein
VHHHPSAFFLLAAADLHTNRTQTRTSFQTARLTSCFADHHPTGRSAQARRATPSIRQTNLPSTSARLDSTRQQQTPTAQLFHLLDEHEHKPASAKITKLSFQQDDFTPGLRAPNMTIGATTPHQVIATHYVY